MISAIGKRLILLKRVQIGDVKLGGLSRGDFKQLTQDEISKLKNL